MFGRYLRLWLVLARFGLLREFAFRGNFLLRIFVEILWLGLQLLFYGTLFTHTGHIADWSERNTSSSSASTTPSPGSWRRSSSIAATTSPSWCATGDLDFILLEAMDEQFLVSCRSIDFACLPKPC